MVRLLVWSGALAVVLLLIMGSPDFIRVAGMLLGSGPKDSAWYVSDASLDGVDEHQWLLSDLVGGILQQVPNSSSIRSHQFDPMPRIDTRGGGGLVFETISYREMNKSAKEPKLSFLYLYLPVDPGEETVKMQFWRGQSPDGSILLMGYVKMETGQVTYGYPQSGYVRVERVAPDRVRVAYAAMEYICASYVGGDGRPEGWLASQDCPQNLFPRSVQYGPKPADAN